jgi:hypothetical protein
VRMFGATYLHNNSSNRREASDGPALAKNDTSARPRKRRPGLACGRPTFNLLCVPHLHLHWRCRHRRGDRQRFCAGSSRFLWLIAQHRTTRTIELDFPHPETDSKMRAIFSPSCQPNPVATTRKTSSLGAVAESSPHKPNVRLGASRTRSASWACPN